MDFRGKIEWAGRMALLILVLASVAFLSAIITMRFAIQGREVTAPSVVGFSIQRSQQELGAEGLHLRIEDRVYSKLPEDAVVRQSPQGGTRLKVGELVHVVVSLGPQKVTIPLLSDRSLRAAQIELLTEGLQVGEVAGVHLPDFPADLVLEQDPTAGSTNAASPHVDLLVCVGQEPVNFVMPFLVGKTLDEAEPLLAALRLKVDKVTQFPLTDRPAGTVTSQLPLRGARVEPGDSVQLQVAQ